MYQAIGKHVVAKQIKEECKTGLLITNATPKVLRYEVISVGEDVNGLFKGDILPVPQYVMHHLEDDLCIISYENIYAKRVQSSDL